MVLSIRVAYSGCESWKEKEVPEVDNGEVEVGKGPQFGFPEQVIKVKESKQGCKKFHIPPQPGAGGRWW